ncbi:hypothetical protein SAMN04487934_103141 [Eubacterium ruminantium]|nr:hypothetical protein SAMN04487934_103141 [Eubacterium ruminantium]
MAEQHVLINEIINDHTERMLNLKKYYPFFVLCDNTFSQYKEGRYRNLDMGYITFAVLRFFIDENNFNERPVEYPDYEKFITGLLKRDFELEESADELKELAAYIFNKINNDGRAFSFSFYDPEERKQKTIRVRLLESNISEGKVSYSITADGIEFYLDTKEVRDESRISTNQLLLEKLIKTENFRGGIDVVKRINSEVARLQKRRDEVITLMASDIKAGSKACDEFMSSTAKWFSEERQSFEKNKNLADKAISRISSESEQGSRRRYAEINELMTELKKAISNHSELIADTAELSRLSEEMISRAKRRALRPVFDYEDVLARIVRSDRPENMSLIVMPFLRPKMHKSFSPMLVDNMLKASDEDSLKGEKVEKTAADLSFKFEDEKLDDMIGHNFGMLFTELLDRLVRWDKLTLKEFIAILAVKFGEEIYDNRDFYSFLVHLAEKEYYVISKVLEKPETVLEKMAVSNMTESDTERYKNLEFNIIYDREEIVLKDDEEDRRVITNMIFNVIKQ